MEPEYICDQYSSTCSFCQNQSSLINEGSELYCVPRDLSTNLKIQCKQPYSVLNSRFIVEKNSNSNQFKKPFRVLCSNCRAHLGYVFSNTKGLKHPHSTPTCATHFCFMHPGVRRASFKSSAIIFVHKETGEILTAPVWMKKWLEDHVITEIETSPRDPATAEVPSSRSSRGNSTHSSPQSRSQSKTSPEFYAPHSSIFQPDHSGSSLPPRPPRGHHHSTPEFDDFSLAASGDDHYPLHPPPTTRHPWSQHQTSLFPTPTSLSSPPSPPMGPNGLSFQPSPLLPYPTPSNGGMGSGHFHNGLFFPPPQQTSPELSPSPGGIVTPNGLHVFDAGLVQPAPTLPPLVGPSGPGSPNPEHVHVGAPVGFHYDKQQHARFEDNISRYRSANKSTSGSAPGGSRRELFAAGGSQTVSTNGATPGDKSPPPVFEGAVPPHGDAFENEKLVDTLQQLLLGGEPAPTATPATTAAPSAPSQKSPTPPISRTSPTPSSFGLIAPSVTNGKKLDKSQITSYSSTVIVDGQGPILQKLVDDLANSTVIGMDCEGMTLSKEGKLCLMQIHVPRSNSTYLIDAISDPMLIARDLKPFLESSDLLKVLHDCRQDSDALYHQMAVRLTNVFDVQAAHNVIKKQQWETHAKFDLSRPFVEFPLPAGFSKLLKLYCSVEFDEKEDTRQAMNDDNAFWAKRPLTQEMKTYAVKDVHYLCQIYDKMKATLLPDYLLAALQRSEFRLAEFRDNPRGGLDWMESVSEFLESVKEGNPAVYSQHSPLPLLNPPSPPSLVPQPPSFFPNPMVPPFMSGPPAVPAPYFSPSAPTFVPTPQYGMSPLGPPGFAPFEPRKKSASTLWTPPPFSS